MTSSVDVLKSNLIDVVRQEYQSSLNSIIANYNKNLDIIQKSRYSNVQKNASIARLTSTKNANINSLNNKYQQSTNNINKYVVPSITISNKKALCIGINYIGTQNELNGCINDALDIQNQLLSYGFTNNNIKVITDNKPIKPTRNNILNSFITLLSNSKKGDLLVFTYSGHGTQSNDIYKTELDGLDESIVTSDFKLIFDYEFKNIIQRYLKPGVSLFALFDNCFSGSVLDLRYMYDSNTQKYLINMNDQETNGNVIMISGCTDSQTSADTFIEKPQGACTWAFLQALKNNPKYLSWIELVTKMDSLLVESKYTQTPKLSCGSILNLDSNVWFYK